MKIGIFAFALALVVTAVLTSIAPASAEEKCTLARVTSLDMRTDGTGRIDVPMTVAGKRANLMVDTGAVFSLLSQALVTSLSLETHPIAGLKFVMFGGLQITHYTTAHDIDIGGLKAPKLDFQVMPDGGLPPDVDGVLAPDILRGFDDDFDFANAKLNLFSPDHCDTDLVYWTSEPHAEIAFRIDETGHIQIPVVLDGKEIAAAVDTGASRSALSLESAENEFGFDETSSLLKIVGNTKSGHGYKYPFRSLVLGDGSPQGGQVSVSNPDLVLIRHSDSGLSSAPPIILGMGILRQLHMYIAYKEKKLYVTAASAH